MTDRTQFISRVRTALGRSTPLATPPVPPAIPEPITRLVHTELGLPDLFARRAREMGAAVDLVRVEELVEKLVAFLRDKSIHTVAVAESGLVKKLNLLAALRDAGFEAHAWDQIAPDDLYAFQCALSDAHCAVAETGTLVVRPSAVHGRALTLVPMYHVAVLEPRNFLPDLVDLFEKLLAENDRAYHVLISGPSKTADIEMNVVTGVHGPNVVQVFVLK